MKFPHQRMEAFVDGLESDINILADDAVKEWLSVSPRQAERDDVAANLLIAADRLAKLAARLQAGDEPEAQAEAERISVSFGAVELELSELDLRTLMVGAWASYTALAGRIAEAQAASHWLTKEPSSVQHLGEVIHGTAEFLTQAFD